MTVEVTVELEGCTPGFWKNHPDVWVVFTPDDKFGDVFGVDIAFRGTGKTTIDDHTLLEALNAVGGGINALASHAVAALLNAAHPDISYTLSVDDVITEVAAAINSGDKDVIENLKNELDQLNNEGCGIDAHGNPINNEEDENRSSESTSTTSVSSETEDEENEEDKGKDNGNGNSKGKGKGKKGKP